MPASAPQRKIKAINLLLAAGSAVFLITGCDSLSVDRDTFISGKKTQLVSGSFSQTYLPSQLDNEALLAIGAEYGRYGDGPVDVVVTYDPASRKDTAMMATTEAGRIAAALRHSGVGSVSTEIMPRAATAEGGGAVLISYSTVSARAPENCSMMGGLDGHATSADKDYGYGCTIETLLSKQINRPADLKGNDTLGGPNSGRRQATIVETHKSGAPKDPLDAYTTQ